MLSLVNLTPPHLVSLRKVTNKIKTIKKYNIKIINPKWGNLQFFMYQKAKKQVGQIVPLIVHYYLKQPRNMPCSDQTKCIVHNNSYACIKLKQQEINLQEVWGEYQRAVVFLPPPPNTSCKFFHTPKLHIFVAKINGIC